MADQPPGFVADSVMPEGFTPDVPVSKTDQSTGKTKWAADLGQHPDNWKDTAADVATGIAKGAARTVVNASDLPTMFGGAGGPDYVDLVRGKPKGTTRQQLADLLTYKNTAQKVGGYGETAAEVLAPAGLAVKAGLSAEAASVPGALSSIVDASGAPMRLAPQSVTYGQRLAAMLPSGASAKDLAVTSLKYGGMPAATLYALARYLTK
jgi:hypothetical protein